MGSGYKCVINACIFAVVLNLSIPFIAKQFFTAEELNSNKDKLPIRQLFIHMFLHQSNNPLIGTVVIVLIVALSIILGYNFKILK